MISSLETLPAEVVSMNLPEFEEGEIKKFNTLMTDALLQQMGKKSSEASERIEYVRSTLERLSLPADFVTEMTDAKAAAKTILTNMAMATSARILCSKAAKGKTTAAKSNSSDCLKFCQEHSLEIPASIQALLSDLVGACTGA